jgi:hypothetical protein
MLVAVVGLMIVAAFFWAITKMNDLKDPLNKPYAFVYSDNATVHWFELSTNNGNVEGKLHQQRYIEKGGKEPVMEEKIYLVTGETTKKGYRFKVNYDEETLEYDAWFSGPHLSLQKQGEKDNKLYNPVDKKGLDSYIEALKDYHSEENEKNRLRTFFTELRSVYGFLYSDKNSPFKLFIKIDEALLQGELSGSLRMIDETGKETTYALNGITDGKMVRLHTTVDGKTTKLEGNFLNGATEFDLSFWKTDKKLMFHAVTEAEYKQAYDEFLKM